MSPRGIAIPDLRERLFGAAERVMTRDGTLTSRAITEEAGCAKGVLHTHFAGLDAFVAELILDRFARMAERAGELPARVGTGAVVDNLDALARAVLALDSAVVAFSLTRPGAAQQVRDAWAAGGPGFGTVQQALDGYLRAEQERGRVAEGADTQSIALALVGTWHHLLMTGAGGPDPRATVARVIRALVPVPAP
ncbi:TetR/AcrR family transcriptional regulator [Streptomyces sp. NPDC048057]|uniref:TetR/AcrR family transcriptional regulator n=1 Tax=Streptomyces sp. NPDC048057 TaxID=3155628 RepID=UPI0033C86604